MAKKKSENASSPNANPRARFDTDAGEMVVELFEDQAENTVANFVSLVEKKFYDGLTFHRVVPQFVVQGGCPLGNGTGGPGYSIKLEAGAKHEIGSIAMARSQHPDSAGSQFYFVTDQNSCRHLDGSYSVFGKIIEGVDAIHKIKQGSRIRSITMISKRDHAYAPKTIGER